jgi:rare lipoprotein A
MIKIYKLLLCGFLFLFHYGYSQSEKTDTTIDTQKIATPDSNAIKYGVASFYADKFRGRRTANGEIYDPDKLTAASNLIPLNTWLKVTNLKNKKTVIVKVNDRMHPKNKRLIDLSRSAAKKLGFISYGIVRVKIEVLGKHKK